MSSVNSIMVNIRSLLTASSALKAGGAAQEPVQTSLNLAAMNPANPATAAQVMGCNCSVNPSGLSPAEIAAAQAKNAGK
ncbi:hypothetical protein J7643_00100 [bacterium]|nr:hypothetical protein [bacterium]